MSTDGKTGAGGRHLKPAEWETIKALYEAGTATIDELATQFEVKPDTLRKRLKREGVVKGSRSEQVAEAAASAAADAAREQAERMVRRIGETKEQHYQYAEAIAKVTMKTIVAAQNKGQALAAIEGDLSALQRAMKTLETARKERWAILGLDNDDGNPEDVPELLVSELTEEQVREIQEQMRQGDNIPPEQDDDGIEELS